MDLSLHRAYLLLRGVILIWQNCKARIALVQTMLEIPINHEGIFKILFAFEMHCMSLTLKFEKNYDNLQREKM